MHIPRPRGRGTFNLEKAGDTFLDLRDWGKGDLWVNGHCLGRYWNIGPTQTAYAPGCWLHAGENEIVILDLLGPRQSENRRIGKAGARRLRPEMDFARVRRPAVKLNLDSATPVHTGIVCARRGHAGNKIRRAGQRKVFLPRIFERAGRQALRRRGRTGFARRRGNAISHDGWTIAYVDSEERDGEDGSAENAIDGQTANFWHTQWSAASPNHPHQLVLEPRQIADHFRFPLRAAPGRRRRTHQGLPHLRRRKPGPKVARPLRRGEFRPCGCPKIFAGFY